MNKTIKIKAANIQELKQIISEYQSIYNANTEQLSKIAENENTSFIQRKLIEHLTHDDNNLSLKAIQWLHTIVTGESIDLELSKEIIYKETGTFNFTIEQEKIYKKIANDNQNTLPGDTYLLKMLAIYIDYFNQLTATLNEIGFKMKYRTGAQQIRPEVTALRDCSEKIESIIKELCLNTASRAKMKLEIKTISNDPLSMLLQNQ